MKIELVEKEIKLITEILSQLSVNVGDPQAGYLVETARGILQKLKVDNPKIKV